MEKHEARAGNVVNFHGEVIVRDGLPASTTTTVHLARGPASGRRSWWQSFLLVFLAVILPIAALILTLAMVDELSLEKALAIGIAAFALPKVLLELFEKADDYEHLPKFVRDLLVLIVFGFSLYGALLAVYAAVFAS